MKKLITLLLVLTGMVSTVSAAEYTIYFTPGDDWNQGNERFAFNTLKKNETSTQIWVDFVKESSTGNGIYKATYDTSKHEGRLIICRMNGSVAANSWDNKWNQSGDLASPTGHIYYNWKNSYTKTPSDYTSTYTIIADGEGDILPNFMDNSSANNSLTSNSDFTYSKTVTGNIVRAGSYGFKITDGSTTYDDGGSAWTVSAAANGVYTIDYTFNCVTGVASATATKTDNATITEKYIIAGDGDLLDGHNWDTSGDYNELTVSDGTGTLEINNMSLSGGSTYYYKAAKLLFNNGVKYKTQWYSKDNSNYYVGRTGVYNAEFTCTISTLASSLDLSELSGYYIYGGNGGWALGERMTESSGSYTYTFNAASGYSFVITPNTNIKTDGTDTVNSWASVVRPNNGNNVVNVNWSNQNGNTRIADVENDKWSISYDGYVTINYTPGDPGTWSVEPYFEREIKAVANNYATFSSDKAVAIPENVTAKYANSVTSGTINWTEFVNGIPANTGALLHATEAGVYKFTPATTTDVVTGNLMVPIATETPLAQSTESGKTNFILSKVADVLGFYKVNTAGSWCAAGTAYLKVATVNASRQFFGLDDETTAVNNVSTESANDAREYYNLNGQRVMNPTKGLYIVNGKKVIIK